MSSTGKVSQVRPWLCICVSSIGRTDRLLQAIASFGAFSPEEVIIGICDQSPTASLQEKLSGILLTRGAPHFFVRQLGGLSAGRNALITGAPDYVTHFAFPNDSTVFPQDYLVRARRSQDYDVFAYSYMNGDQARYTFKGQLGTLDRINVWRIIEPAMILSRNVFESVGLFDESIGTGSAGSLQSGEGTDLLLRLLPHKPRAFWDSGLCVEGVEQNYGLTPRQNRRKLRAYGRGYGHLLRKYGYPKLRVVCSIVAPVGKAFGPSSFLQFWGGFMSSIGRLEGYFAKPEVAVANSSRGAGR